MTPPFPPGSPYYDNVRPLCYSDSDAVLLCFDVSRPETLDSAAKKVGRGLRPQDSVPVGFGELRDVETPAQGVTCEVWGAQGCRDTPPL